MNRFELLTLKLMQFVLLTVCVLWAYSLLQRAHVQYDATEEKLIQLSDETVAIINGLNSEKPVVIRAFFSNEVPKDLVETKTNLENFLGEIGRISNGKVRVNITYLNANTPEAYQVENLYDIKPRRLMEAQSGNPRPMEVYLGLLFSSGVKERTIDFFERGMSEELELARSIKVVNGDSLRRVGILYTDAHLMGDFDMVNFKPIPGWRFVEELRKQYDVVGLSPENLRKYYYDGGAELKAADHLDVLVVPMASALTEREMYYLHQYIWTGAAVLILDDPWPAINWQLAPKQPKQRRQMPGQPPEMGPPPAKGDIENLFKAMGVQWNSGDVVWASYNPHPSLGLNDKYVFFLGPKIPEGNRAKDDARWMDCFAENDDTVNHLQEIVMLYPGGIDKTATPPVGIEIQPLLKSPIPNGRHNVEVAFAPAFNRGQPQEEPRRLTFYSDTHDSITLAARITGSMRNAYPNGLPPQPGNSPTPDPDGDKYTDPAKQPAAGADKTSAASIHVIFIPDIDMISDQFFEIRDQEPEFGGIRLDFDNTRFVLNCVDSLAGDATFLKLRNRRPIHRPMERMDEYTRQMTEEMAAALKATADDFQKEIDDANARLKKTREEIDARTDLDQHAKDVKLAKDWKIEETRTKLHIKSLGMALDRLKTEKERETRTQIEQERFFVMLWPIVIPVSLIVLIGLAVFGYKLVSEKTEVPSARKRT